MPLNSQLCLLTVSPRTRNQPCLQLTIRDTCRGLVLQARLDMHNRTLYPSTHPDTTSRMSRLRMDILIGLQSCLLSSSQPFNNQRPCKTLMATLPINSLTCLLPINRHIRPRSILPILSCHTRNRRISHFSQHFSLSRTTTMTPKACIQTMLCIDRICCGAPRGQRTRSRTECPLKDHYQEEHMNLAVGRDDLSDMTN